MAEIGNEYNSGDIIEVLLAVKANTMKDTHVAEICKVTSKTELPEYTTYFCKSINNSELTLDAYALSNLTINVNDYVLILICDDDFRANYRRLKTGKEVQNVQSSQKHSIAYGIIIGLI